MYCVAYTYADSPNGQPRGRKGRRPSRLPKKLLAVCQIDVESVVVQKEHEGDKACHRRQILRCDKHEHCTHYGPEVEVNGRRRVQGRTEMWGAPEVTTEANKERVDHSSCPQQQQQQYTEVTEQKVT